MRLIFRFLKDIYIYSKKLFTLNIFLMIISGLFAGIGVAVLIPLLSLTGIETSETFKWMDKFNYMLEPYTYNQKLLIVLGGYIFIIATQAWLKRISNILNSKMIQGYIRSRRVSLYDKVINSKFNYINKKKKSEIINLFTTEINRITLGTMILLKLVANSFGIIIQLAIAFYISVPLTFLTIGFGIAVFIFLKRSFKDAKISGMNLQKINQNLLGELTEHLAGIREIKGFGKEKQESTKFRKINRKMENNLNKFVKIQSKPDFYYKISSAIMISIIFFVAITYLNIEIGVLLLIIYIFARLLPIFSGLQNSIQQILVVIPSYRKLLDLEEEVQKNRDIKIENESSKKLEMKSHLKMEDIFFSYLNSEDFQLNNISLTIPANKIIAFAGESGAGKSTIVEIISGLIEPDKGKLILDNKLLGPKEIRRWRKSVGYVSQDPFLFNGTIKENLIRFNPDISDKEIKKALKMSSAEDFINNLPNGLDTKLGDNGVNLSGGEKQRIAIARTLLKKPSLLILDEATSALDYKNEMKIKKALEKIKKSITVILIAHRRESIKDVDEIYVIEKGEIIGQGKYDELIQKQNGYLNEIMEV